jgi:oxaloacetate decarboxylase gamma subunit
MENVGLGLVLMVVGMVTVFLILMIVIFGSQLMIRLVNRIAPAQSEKAPVTAAVDPLTRQVLEAAVAQLTGGEGHITNITKVQ